METALFAELWNGDGCERRQRCSAAQVQPGGSEEAHQRVGVNSEQETKRC